MIPQPNNATTLERRAIRATSPIVLCAADEGYAMPLAVTLHSAVTNLRDGEQMHVVLLDGGISESSWIGMQETLVGLPISINVIRPNLDLIKDLSTSHHISHAAYLRLLADQLLPDWIDKVIYLDSDLLVLDDLCELWNMDPGAHYCLAAVDISCPFVDIDSVLKRASEPSPVRFAPYVGALTPIPNWRQLGLDGTSHYFNSGVMVLNLKRWREDHVSRRLFECLRANAEHVWCWDQYALNVVCAGQWGRLPDRWNQGTHVYEYPDAKSAPISEDRFQQMRDNPAIVHFTTEYKPWNFRPFHPQRQRFFEHLDQTAFADWRPEDPGFQLSDWWTFHLVQFIRKWTVKYRKWIRFRHCCR